MSSEQDFISSIKAHEGIIHKVCVLYQQDPLQRQDLFQEIVMNAWKGYGAFRRDALFSTWLYRIAINTAISFFRQSKKRIQTIQLPVEPAAAWMAAPEDQRNTVLYEAIGGLSKVDKALVMLYLDDFSYAEIASLLGMSENLVAVKMARVRQRLKKIILHNQLSQ
jgi:RNA polymerase sigma-70 factor, ECF subfamily